MLPALLEESAPIPREPRVRGRIATSLVVAACAVGLAACGGGERQDENEPEGEFPVSILSADFPAQQRLAQTSELTLEVQNTGDEVIPDLAVTIFTDADISTEIDDDAAAASDDEDGGAVGADGEPIPESQLDDAVDQKLEEALAEDEGDDADSGDETSSEEETTTELQPEAAGAFSVLSQQKGLAIPSRPVWILEQGFPECVSPEAESESLCAQTDLESANPPPGEIAGGSGAEAAQTDTFSFGEVQPDQTVTMVWRVTPVQAGNYTVHYRLAAGLQGNAVAVNEDGSTPEGEFVVVIDDSPPQTRVDDSGKVVPIKPSDIIGQAGSDEQQDELSP